MPFVPSSPLARRGPAAAAFGRTPSRGAGSSPGSHGATGLLSARSPTKGGADDRRRHEHPRSRSPWRLPLARACDASALNARRRTLGHPVALRPRVLRRRDASENLRPTPPTRGRPPRGRILAVRVAPAARGDGRALARARGPRAAGARRRSDGARRARRGDLRPARHRRAVDRRSRLLAVPDAPCAKPTCVELRTGHVELGVRVGVVRALLKVPQWFDEGLAVLFSADPGFAEARWLAATDDGARAPYRSIEDTSGRDRGDRSAGPKPASRSSVDGVLKVFEDALRRRDPRECRRYGREACSGPPSRKET